MQSEQTQTAWYYDFLGWADSHKKQVIQITAGVLVFGLIVSYFFWSRGAKEDAAAREFSRLVYTKTGTDALLKFQAQNRNTSAGADALLMAAQNLFTAGRFPEAQEQFQKFRQEYRSSPFLSSAILGVATSLEAQGKTDEAIAAYTDLSQRRTPDMPSLQAQFALARLFESKNQFEDALRLYAGVEQANGNGNFGAEAAMRASELRAKHPELVKAPAAPTDLPINLNQQQP